MNQLEYFVASTHGSRSDIMRYMQQLRNLDEWIEYHLDILRAVAAERVAYQSTVARRRGRGGYKVEGGRGVSSKALRSSNIVARGRGRARGGGRGRGIEEGPVVLAEESPAAHFTRHDDATPSGGKGLLSADSEAADAAYWAGLQRQFLLHETCVRRHCDEREAVVAELAERCAEVRLSMAARLANFSSVADVPVTELTG